MSASREKKTRLDPVTQAPTQREQKKQQKAQEERRTNLQYAAVGIVCVLLSVLVIVWNTGLIQRNATAAVVKDVTYTTVDVQYYFNSTKQNVINTYIQYLGTLPFDYNISTKNQIFDAATGQTWFDYLMEQTLDTMASHTAMHAALQAEGYTMSADAQEYLTTTLADLDGAWKNAGYTSSNAYLRANYGPYITYDLFVKLITKDVLVSDYMNSISAGFEFGSADYQTYYQDNAATLDTFTLTTMVLNASIPTTDDSGNPIERTEEETAAALDEAKAEKLAIAEEIQAKLNDGADPAEVAEEYADQLAGEPAIAQTLMGSTVASTSYSEWAADDARQLGDVTVSESAGSSTSCSYYVVQFEGRALDTRPTNTVRHILVAAQTDEGADAPTDEQYSAAKVEAEALLAQWQAGGATEDVFAQLAQEHSADTGSAIEGGLIANIHSGSGYVATFADWSTDPARQPGDTGIVQNTGSSVKGWHIMYYVGAIGQPAWEQSADSALRSDAYSSWNESVQEGYLAVAKSMGQKFIKG